MTVTLAVSLVNVLIHYTVCADGVLCRVRRYANGRAYLEETITVPEVNLPTQWDESHLCAAVGESAVPWTHETAVPLVADIRGV